MFDVVTRNEFHHALKDINQFYSKRSEFNTLNQSVTQSVNDGCDRILAAIDQAVFDKALLVSILNGTCENLTGDAITAIADYVFYEKKSLKTIDLPNCISIGNSAFNGCDNLTQVKSPNVIEIDDYAFAYSGIETVNFPNAITIGYGSFSYLCDGITKIDENDLPKVKIIPDACFEACYLLQYVRMNDAETIGNAAFLECNSLESVYFPNVKTLGDSAFLSCDELTSVYLPNVTKVGSQTFTGCIKLSEINIPKVEALYLYTFRNCTSLLSFNAENVTSIGEGAFNGCTALKKVYISNKCTDIKASSYSKSPFFGCTNSSLKIFCEAPSKPSGWGTYWNYYYNSSGSKATVVWGATKEEYDAY